MHPQAKACGCKTHFAIHKIEPAGGEADESWRGDKYGKAYLEALEAAVGTGRLGDRHIVFASADRAASSRMAEAFPTLMRGERLPSSTAGMHLPT